ncbi:MAG: branched-chain alpha-keto acid dehydrogenase subunit [Nocardioides sp.]|jgi:2-oxoisovalerate dehydrogenase E2 component (dihydrolipoyl transacylase)|nr:branched-chain alpha-keto acid dehydrogenase subunit [Nocardioides sp.]
MSLLTTFKLPDVGEGLTEAEVVTWHVTVGDRIEVNEPLVDIETAKSVVELPSPVAGVVATLHVEEGTTVPVGSALVSLREDGNDAELEAAAVEPEAKPEAPGEEAPLILVGTGPTAAVARRLRLRTREHRAHVPPVQTAAPPDGQVLVKPPVRFLARRLGVDLSLVASSGVIGRADVERYAEGAAQTGPSAPDVTETRIPIKGVRKATAAAMTASAFTAPHVTEFLTVDVTATMDLVRRLKASQRWHGVRITPLLVVAKAFLLAIREYPEINARWDDVAQEIVIRHDVNLGIAVATPRGLLVPNIKGAGDLGLRELGVQLDKLVQTARSGRTAPAEMARGTVTLTNIGALGVDTGTPILNPGEAAILAFGAVREMPWVVEGQVVVRMVTQLAISFDHRLVDGELGSSVLAHVGRLLNDPALAMAHA